MNLELLLTHPELANNIRFEITGENLLELAATVIKAAKDQNRQDDKELFLTLQEVMKMVKRSQPTLSRWNKLGILKPNHIGLYKKSEVVKFLEKK